MLQFIGQQPGILEQPRYDFERSRSISIVVVRRAKWFPPFRQQMMFCVVITLFNIINIMGWAVTKASPDVHEALGYSKLPLEDSFPGPPYFSKQSAHSISRLELPQQ